jgi:hypothetical protein
MNLEIRAEWFNIFNRIGVPGPTTANALATQAGNASSGVPSSGFGYMNSASPGGPRNGQIVARFQF